MNMSVSFGVNVSISQRSYEIPRRWARAAEPAKTALPAEAPERKCISIIGTWEKVDLVLKIILTCYFERVSNTL